MVARSLRYAPLLAVLAGLIWLVAPALSTQRYLPEAVDFEQALPGAERLAPGERTPRSAAPVRSGEHRHGGPGPVTLRTAPIEAPRRFDLVGVAGEMRPLEFRARTSGSEWSDWVETANGDPVYTGGSDEVQVRSRGVPIEGTLHYVNVSGDDTAANGLLNGLRSAVNSGVLTLGATPIADAASPKPSFVSRRDWGANRRQAGCEPRTRPETGRVKAGVIHHTVSTNNYSEAEVPGMVLGICRFHRNGNGWNDIGYNALVDRFGNLYEGRAGGLARPVVGAQSEGHNSQTTGIATIANHSETGASTAERRSIVRYLAWKLDLAGVSATGNTRLKSAGGSTTRTDAGERIRVKPIVSHSDLNFTECAGTLLRPQIGKIRRAVQRRIDRFGGGAPEEPVPERRKKGKRDRGGGDGGGVKPSG